MSRQDAMQIAVHICSSVGSDLSTERPTSELSPPGSSERLPAADSTIQVDMACVPVESVAEHDPDQDVLQLISRGHTTEAFRLLMERHGRMVYRYCGTVLRDMALAEDATQQVFISAFTNFSKFTRRATLRTWLFSIARHRVLDAVKSRARANAHAFAAELADAELVIDPQPSPVDRLDHMRFAQILVDALHRLDETSRDAILLRFQGGLSYDEIAQLLQIRSGALQMRVSRALRVLRRALQARLAADESRRPRDPRARLEPRPSTKTGDTARPATATTSAATGSPAAEPVRPARASA